MADNTMFTVIGILGSIATYPLYARFTRWFWREPEPDFKIDYTTAVKAIPKSSRRVKARVRSVREGRAVVVEDDL